MSRTLGWLLGVLVVLAVGYGVVLAMLSDARLGPGPSPEGQRPSEERAAAVATPDPGEYETVAVTIEIPAVADVPTGGSHRGPCPQDRLCNILRVRLDRPHGLVVGRVVPDGPAGKAGIMPGDRLGDSSACPSTVLSMFRPGAEPRQIELTIRRPVEGAEVGVEPEDAQAEDAAAE